MAESSKDTVYIDVDDDITTLIDKVRGSSSNVVALVLPKRAAVLQSLVNMKLLKRTAENQKKNIVLITAEAGLLPLAGAAGLHVASSLTSKPSIPSAPTTGNLAPETINEDMNLEDDVLPNLAETAGGTAAVGALADAAEKPVSETGSGRGLDTLEFDNDSADEEKDAAAAAATAGAIATAKKDKHLKVPNFNRFRTLILLGILLLVAIIVLAIFAFSVLPHATINVQTDASNVNTNLTLTLDTQASSVDTLSGDLPAKMVTEQKTFTQTANATGQKNEGNTATGQVDMTAGGCSFNQPNDVPAGTAVTSNSLTYITQQDASFSPAVSHGKCVWDTGEVPISAQSPGANYNTNGNTNFDVTGFSGVNATGSASGGTDNIVTIVSQSDVANATSKLNANNSGSVKQDLINQLNGQGLYPINATFMSGNAQTNSNPSVGDASNTVTVTETITYSMYGAKQADLDSVLNTNIHSQTHPDQNIISNGLNQSAFRQVSANGSSDQVALATLAEVGPDLPVAQLKKEAAGKSPQAIISAIKNNPDVTSVTVKLSPFWVSSAPSNVSKINVKVAKPSQTV